MSDSEINLVVTMSPRSLAILSFWSSSRRHAHAATLLLFNLACMAGPEEAEVRVSGSHGRAAAYPCGRMGCVGGLTWLLLDGKWLLLWQQVTRPEEGKVPHNGCSDIHLEKAGFSSYKWLPFCVLSREAHP